VAGVVFSSGLPHQFHIIIRKGYFMNKRYNMYNLDVRVKNVNELNELEYSQFNHQAKEAAQRVLENVSRMGSGDYQEQVAKWINELANQNKRANQRKVEPERDRDEETGRYVSKGSTLFPEDEPVRPNTLRAEIAKPSVDDWLQQALSEYKAKYERATDQSFKTASGSSSEPTEQASPSDYNPNVLPPGHKWGVDKVSGNVIPVPVKSKSKSEYAPGTGEGFPRSPVGNGVGNMAYLSPEQINKALGKRGNR
jgi:hypothetical protein